jgi:hypothetical protein
MRSTPSGGFFFINGSGSAFRHPIVDGPFNPPGEAAVSGSRSPVPGGARSRIHQTRRDHQTRGGLRPPLPGRNHPPWLGPATAYAVTMSEALLRRKGKRWVQTNGIRHLFAPYHSCQSPVDSPPTCSRSAHGEYWAYLGCIPIGNAAAFD